MPQELQKQLFNFLITAHPLKVGGKFSAVKADFLRLCSKCMEYDNSIVRQMVECIKVYPGGKLEIIFGGGYLVEESV